MKKFILVGLLLSGAQAFAEKAFISYCDRHPKVKEALELNFEKPCHRITGGELPASDFSLELENIDPSELKVSDFEALAGIHTLKIVGNPKVKRPIDVRIFAILPALSNLTLINIDLSAAPLDFLIKNGGLSRLTLKNCNLKQFPKLSGRLSELDLSQNRITHLPQALPGFDRNSSILLDLENNGLSDISALIDLPNSFNHINLAGNPLRPMDCAKQNQLFEKQWKGDLTINTLSINMSCSLEGGLLHSVLTLHGGSVSDFSPEFTSSLRKRSVLGVSQFKIDENFNRLIKESDIGLLILKNSDITGLRLREELSASRLITLSIVDETRNALPDIFAGATMIRALFIDMPNLNYIPENLFRDLPNIEHLSFINTPLANTSKAALAGIPSVLGLPTNFGATDTGGTSEEWAP